MKKVFAMAIFLLSFVVSVQAQEYTNSKNPFDNYGTIHNEILSDLVAKKLPKGLPIETVMGEVRKTIEGNDRYLSLVGQGNLELDNSLIDRVYKDFPNNCRNLIAGTKYSEPTKVFLQRIMDKSFQTGVTYADFIQFMKNEEDKILFSDITKAEKSMLLQYASVGRHSAYLWRVKYPLDGAGTSTNGKANKPRGIFVVCYDLAGFGFGGPAGMAYGSMAGYYSSGAF